MNSSLDLERALISPLRDADRLVELIAFVTGATQVEIRERLAREYQHLGSNVSSALSAHGVKPHVWSDSMAVFYEKSDAFLYETIVWNLTYAKCQLRNWILDYLHKNRSIKTILTLGDGLGFDSYFLAEQGYAVTYFEVSQPCADFATRIFQDGNMSIEVLTDPQKLTAITFDAVICLDVLEHVPDPNSLVQRVSDLIRPDGILMVSAPFFLIDPSLQTHLLSNCRYSGDFEQLYRAKGLTPVGGRLFWNPIVLEKSKTAPVPAKIRLGSFLLKLAKYFPWPFIKTSNAMVKKKFPLDL